MSLTEKYIGYEVNYSQWESKIQGSGKFGE